LRRRGLHFLVVVVLVGYTLVSTSASFAIGGIKSHPSRELFPFFTWSLFSWIPETRHQYVIEIQRIDGQRYDPPTHMQEFEEFADGTTLAYKTIQDLGRSGGADDRKRATFETRYLKGRNVDYRIVRLSFAPLERWHHGTTRDSTVIAEFTTTADP